MNNSEQIKIDFLPAVSLNFCRNLKNTISLWPFGTQEQHLNKGFYKLARRFSADSPDFAALSLGMTFWNWQQFPLDRQTSRRLDRELGPNSAQATGIKKILRHITPPAGDSLPLSDLHQLLETEDQALIIKNLMPLLRSEKSLLWLGEAWDTLLRLGNPDIAYTALDMTAWPEGTATLKRRLSAELSFLYKGYSDALRELDTLEDKIWPLWKNYIKAELLSLSGDPKSASVILSHLWQKMPWQVNWGLKLHTLLNPVPTENALNESCDVSILMYSWNNAELIRNTLENVSRSKLGAARVFALNNGSSDGTGEVIDKAAELFGKGRYQSVHLPVNAGAPAARNWLLSLPEVRRGKWAVFLDDDVNLPDNWLEELLATARHYGDPGAVGCRITSASDPKTLQSADYHLFPPGSGSSQIEGLEENIMIHDNCCSALDYGQFTYCRPALHVSGCCHMLSLEAVNSCGSFDVRFNPTQFDDLERDLRAFLANRRHIYAGQLPIRHIQHSSLAKAASIRSMAQVFGNKIKLEGKFTEEEIAKMAARDLEELWRDMLKKWDELEGQLPENG